jgi:hypothetical protein
MARLLLTQERELRRVVRDVGLRPSLFKFTTSVDHPKIEYRPASGTGRFSIEGARNEKVRLSPGEKAFEETASVQDFNDILVYFHRWLSWLKRELRSIELEGAGDDPPAWLFSALPQRFMDLQEQISKLNAERDGFLRIGELLWQTGQPLNEAVANFFNQMGHGATLTAERATYDVTVDLGESRRLLIEVTGIEGSIQKKSPKIGQLFQTSQEEATDTDRVILAANVNRTKSASERSNLPAITPDALRLVSRLGANFVTTQTLYDIWKIGLHDRSLAQSHIMNLHRTEGQFFRLPETASAE